MASSFPGTLDSFATNRADATAMATNHAADHNNYADAINTLERTFGPDVFSVLNYGATGNGSTDDTAAIQAAIDAAEAYTIASTRGATVYFPSGVYRTSVPLTVARDNIVLMGMGRTAAGMNPVSAEATGPVTGGSLIQPLPSFAGAWVIDVSFDTPSVRALAGNWIDGIYIDGYYIPAGATGGIRFSVFRGGMRNVGVQRTGQNGATGPAVEFKCVDDVTTWPKGAWDCVFTNCVFQASTGPCFYAPGQSSDSIISNCIIQQSDTHGIHLVGSGWVIADNYILFHEGCGIYTEGRQYNIVGNRIRECVGGIELHLDSYAAGFNITGNLLRSCSQGGDNTNDVITVTASATSEGGVISGNSFETMPDSFGGESYRPRYLINITSSNSVGVEIGPYGAGFVSPAVSAFGTAAINDAGTNTRIVTGGQLKLKDAATISVGTTTGTKIGTATSQKLGFYNATPIVQPANTTDIKDALVNLGLLASGGATPLDLDSGHLTAASASLGTNPSAAGTLRLPNATYITARNAANSADINMVSISGTDRVTFGAAIGSTNVGGGASVNFGDGANIAAALTTGMKIGTGTTQKIGFWNATPVVQPTAVTDATGGTTIDAEARTALNALLARLRTIGIITT